MVMLDGGCMMLCDTGFVGGVVNTQHRACWSGFCFTVTN